MDNDLRAESLSPTQTRRSLESNGDNGFEQKQVDGSWLIRDLPPWAMNGYGYTV